MEEDRLEDMETARNALAGDISDSLYSHQAGNIHCKNCASGGELEIIGVKPVIMCKATDTYVSEDGNLARECGSYEPNGGISK